MTPPDSWNISSIGQVFTVVGGGTPSTKNIGFWEGHIPWISSADVGDSVNGIAPRKGITEAAVAASATNIVPSGTVVVVARVGVGKVAVADGNLAYSQDCQGLLPRPDVSPMFTAYQLKTLASEMRFRSQGTTISGITKKQLLSMPFSFPELPEQRRIVETIEEQFSRLDAAEGSLSRAERNLSNLAKAQTSRLFSGGWSTKRLDEITSVFADCPHRTPLYTQDGYYPALRPRDVVDGRLDLLSAARVDEAEYRLQVQRHVPSPGDVVYSRELSYGWAAEVPEGAEPCLSQGMVVMRPAPDVEARYLVGFLNSMIGRGLAERAAVGTAHPHINLRDIRAYPVPVPPLEKQSEMLERLETLTSVHHGVSEGIAAVRRRVGIVRRVVLRDAFAGRLVVQCGSNVRTQFLPEKVKA